MNNNPLRKAVGLLKIIEDNDPPTHFITSGWNAALHIMHATGY